MRSGSLEKIFEKLDNNQRNIFLVAFLYQVIFVNLPFQEAPKEIIERWNLETKITNLLMSISAGISIVSGAIKLYITKIKEK